MSKETAIIEDKEVAGRELIGIVREAFAFQDDVYLMLASGRVTCEILSFEDGDLRNPDSVRAIEIALPNPTEQLISSSSDEILIEIVSKVKKARLVCKIRNRLENTIVLDIPRTAKLFQVRSSKRFSTEESGWTGGLLYTDSVGIPCLYQILDISKEGIGLRLVSSIRLSEEKKMQLEGRISTEKFDISGIYEVVRVSLKKNGNNFYEYIIGLKNRSKTNVDKKNVMRASRHKVDQSINCFLSASGARINIKIFDVSVSGFRGQVSISLLNDIAIGLILVEETKNIRFKVVRVSPDGLIGFSLVTETPEEKIKWLNLIAPILNGERVKTSVSSARELVSLFFEAGASIVDGIEYKRFEITKKEALSILTEKTDVMMRWVNLSDAGRILGHHSTYRIGQSSWYTGDLVGGQSRENKADRFFFDSNFRILREVMEDFSSKQKILGFWKPDHPYWQKWRNFLLDNKLTYCLEECDSITRNKIKPIPGFDWESVKAHSSFNELDGKDLYETIRKLSEGQQWFLGALDVYSAGNLSNGIKELYIKNGRLGFKRGVYKFKYKNKAFLAVFSQMPPGISINGTFDSVFVFPLHKNFRLTSDQQNELYFRVLCFGSSHGYKIHSLRFFSKGTKILGNRTEFFVIDHRGLEVF